MPAAPRLKAITKKTAPISRAAPPRMDDQPIQKKSCRPCSKPPNIGAHKEASSSSNVTHNPSSFGRCQPATIFLRNTNTTAAPSAHTPKVHNQVSRIKLASCRSRPVASACAACCTNTICRGMVGRHATTISSTPNAEYSAGLITLLRKCTPHAIAPPAMAAIISQPLWRKNAACGLWSTVGMGSTFSALMNFKFSPGGLNQFKPRNTRTTRNVFLPGPGRFYGGH